MITMGSLFSGFGGFELAAKHVSSNKIEILWQSEIEPWAVELLKQRFPNTKQLGDIQNINGAEIEPVDIITFGSPCQNMSIAGNRKGLAGEQSGLFYEAIRIIKEMRRKTNGEYPKYIVWENVNGALTSNKGADFKAVLEEITESKIPMPQSGRWANAGMVRGGAELTFHGVSWMPSIGEYPREEKESTLWEIIEQNVPQKYYLSQKACQGILRRVKNKGKKLPPPLEKALERQAEFPIEELLKESKLIEHLNNNYYRICSYASNSMNSNNPNSGVYKTDTTPTLDLNGGNPACNQGGMCIVESYIINDQGGSFINIEKGKVSPTLRANMQGRPPLVSVGINKPLILDSYPNDSRIKINENNICQTLTNRMGTGGGNVPMCMMPIYSLDKTTCDLRKDSQYGMSINENISQTCIARGANAVAIPHNIYSTSKISYHTIARENIADTLVASDMKDPPCVMIEPYYLVRRLTPAECAKLQGFPADWHENIKNSKGKELPNSAAYKGYGNAVATVCAEYPLKGIYEILMED